MTLADAAHHRIAARLSMALALLAAGIGAGACAPDSRVSGGEDRVAVDVIEHTFVPRLVSENYWEPVKLPAGEDRFVLLVHPRLEVPSEGPWNLSIRNAAGHEAFRASGQRVDVATGSLTLLCEAAHFPPGDWTLELSLEDGGRTSGPTSHVFRFRRE